MSMASCWSYVTGNRGLNRIRVYERYPGSPIQVEWYDKRGRQRETLKHLAGAPIHDRDLAIEIADHMAAEQKKKREAQTAHELFGRPSPKTLEQLFKALHDARASDWSKTYKQQQESVRDFWLDALGSTTKLQDVTPNVAETKLKVLAEAKKFKPRTKQKYLRYLVDAYTFARRKLKWITEQHDLSAMTMPKPDGRGVAYSDAEIAALLKAAPKVDLRCWAIGEIAYATGRRLSAIRQLKVTAYRRELAEGVEVPVVAFPGETDKGRKEGIAVLTRGAVQALEALLKTPAVQATGLLFPGGDLATNGVPREPETVENLTEQWHLIEQAAEVPYVRGRAFHGIKRRFTTTAGRLLDMGTASKQSGTTRATLERIYEQDDLEAKIELAKRLDGHREGLTRSDMDG